MKKAFKKPVLVKEDHYKTAGSYHCTQIKECDPNYAK